MKRFSFLLMSLLLVACAQKPVPLSDPAENPDGLVVTSFEECVEATGIVMESFPRQCRFEDMVFIEDINEMSQGEELDENADMKVFLKSALQAFLGSTDEYEIELQNVGTDHVRGMFRAPGEQAGALFLAAWEMGEWEIVFAGNGAISCDEVAPYDFPAEMIEDCN